MLRSFRNTQISVLLCAGLFAACNAEKGRGGTAEPTDGAIAMTEPDAEVSDETDAGDDPSDLPDGGELGPCDAGQSEGCIVSEPDPTCGDGLINVTGEQCDDKNSVSDDGCTATCMRDPDYACPEPGKPCVYSVKCGDGKISGEETCEDGNVKAGDGCDAGCKVEEGYACPVVGLRCQAASCGDGIVAGFEECDFMASVDGCSDCRIDADADCDDTGCHATICGDGKTEHGEQCDDGDQDPATADAPFDGCFACKAEPDCAGGLCMPVCGDGQRFSGEACDDGNLRNGDGCSDACAVETGYACDDQLGEPAATVQLPIVFRDFIGKDRSLLSDCESPITVPGTLKPCFHIDFNRLSESTPPGILESALDANGRPVYTCPDPDTACSMNPGHVTNRDRFTFNGKGAFAAWYDTSSPFVSQVIDGLTLTRNVDTGVYVFDSAPTGGFYPIDGKGWVQEGSESPTKDCSDGATAIRNVSFTSETHFWFEYQGGEEFEFVGDDDLWVFVNGQLALDLGGLHGARTARFALGPVDDTGDGTLEVAVGTARVKNQLRHDLNDPTKFDLVELGLALGGVYEISMFHAERNECGSNFKVTLKDFNRPKSSCASECGDGKLASDEVCDLGDDNLDPPPYEGCSEDCKTRGHYCGDGLTDDSDGEACDDGANVTVYGSSADDCAPDCKKPAFCGDGVVQSAFGEKCDDAKNDGSYGACAPGCVLGPRCGDRKVQEAEGEECDDGNRDNYDGCNAVCRREIIL